MDFKIVDTKPLNKNTLRGSFSLLVGPLKIEGLTYHVKGDRSWVSFPTREYTTKDGEKKYLPIVRIEDEDRYKAFQKWAVDQVSEIFEKPEPQGPMSHPKDDDIPF